MTEKHTDNHGNRLSLYIYPDSPSTSVVAVRRPSSMIGGTVALPTDRLLAMIDAADPAAMRAYLLETVEPNLACKHHDEVPEADSPEDVDGQAVLELTDDIDTRLHVIERLAKVLRAGTDAVEVCTLADWVIDR